MMKNILILGFIVIFILVAILAFVPSSKNTAFTLYRESGEVLYWQPNDKEYLSLQDDSKSLPTDTAVKTRQGYAHVEYVDGSTMSLDANSEVKITSNRTLTTIQQIAGNTWHRIVKLTTGRNYEVETPTTVATVRGTEFAVEMGEQNENAEILVTDSVVEVSKITHQGAKKIRSNKQQRVEAGKMFSRDIVQQIAQNRKESGWFKRNKSLPNGFIKKIKERKTIQIKNFIPTGIIKQFEMTRDKMKNELSQSPYALLCNRIKGMSREQIMTEARKLAKQYKISTFNDVQMSIAVEELIKKCPQR